MFGTMGGFSMPTLKKLKKLLVNGSKTVDEVADMILATEGWSVDEKRKALTIMFDQKDETKRKDDKKRSKDNKLKDYISFLSG